MSDLISRSALIKELCENTKIGFYGEFTDGSEVAYTQREIISAINNHPTAYDVEKVVEQIKDKAWSGNIYDGKIWVQHAEEIIRKGGVNERD